MMNSEIITAVAEGLEFTLILVDNKGYGSIRRLQMETGSPSFNNELRHRARSGRTDGPVVHVDFAKHAEAMGATAWHVTSYKELESALVSAKKTSGVKVIVVPVSLDESARGFESWWDAPMSEVSGRTKVIKARKQYEAKVKRQRKYFRP
jgi:3D-(3,5/4)-trihydroxycyclohexane-1,2-dione acylhydrolase (decyclizing)